jgi:hypothetical protein
MFHTNTQTLIDYWTARTVSGRMPSRAAIDPGDFRQLLSQVFVLGREARGRYAFRLAGGFIAELHQRDLRRESALGLWSERDRLRLQTALEEVRARPEPLVVMAEVLTDGPSLSLEVLFTPLAAHDGGPERYLGLYQPLGMVSRLQGRPALELSLRAIRRPAPANDETPLVRLSMLQGGALV